MPTDYYKKTTFMLMINQNLLMSLKGVLDLINATIVKV